MLLVVTTLLALSTLLCMQRTDAMQDSTGNMRAEISREEVKTCRIAVAEIVSSLLAVAKRVEDGVLEEDGGVCRRSRVKERRYFYRSALSWVVEY